MPFDPKAYAAKTTMNAGVASGFDPKAYLSKAETQAVDEPWITGKGLLKGAVESLPVAGGLAGGALGLAGGPLGSVAGAGLGGAAGESIKRAVMPLLEGGYGKQPTELKELGKGLLETGKAGAEMAAGEAGGQVLSKVIPKAVELSGKAAKKISSALTGISEKEIQTYADPKRFKEIQQLMKESGGDMQQAVDNFREEAMTKIGQSKQKLGESIGAALEEAAPKVGPVKVDPVIEKLQAAKAKLDPKLWGKDIAEIDDLIEKVSSVGGKQGAADIRSIHEIKEWLQDQAKSSYLKQGQLFSKGDKAQNAAKMAAREARKLVSEAVPAVAEANAKLASLHDVENTFNRNLLKSGATPGSVYAAGGESATQSRKALEKISEITGEDLTKLAENLAAARTFQSPGLLPQYTTGKSALASGLGTGAGYLLGGPVGTAVGGAMTSPLVLKGLLQAGQIAAPAVGMLGQAAIPASKAALFEAQKRGLLRGK